MDFEDNRQPINVRNFDDLIDRVARFDSFTIEDRQYSAELLIPQLTINNKDLVSECATVSSWATYWGLAASRARHYKARVDAAYRAWKDYRITEAKATDDPETGKRRTEADCERYYRMHPEYIDWNMRRNDAQRSAEFAEAIYEGFKLKSKMIDVTQRLLRDEAGGPYYIIEDDRLGIERQPQI